MDQSATGDETRPDGRVSSAATLALREATRLLRLHLDRLPAVFHFGGPGDQFLAESAFPFARHRYDCAESLIGAGFGGTVVGALARSLFVDGLRWQWISAAPAERRKALMGSMLDERNRIYTILDSNDASCPILARWFAPLLDVTDLTGASLSWLSAPSLPDEDELLDTFLVQLPASVLGKKVPAGSLTGAGPHELLAAARSMMAIAGLRGAVTILAHAGHGNLLGLQSSLTRDGAPGHDLRPDHEALFMQVAAVGVTVTLLGVCAAVPECWPEEIDQRVFLEEALRLTQRVATAATALHGLGPVRSAAGVSQKVRTRSGGRPVLQSGSLLSADDLLPDINSADRVKAAAEDYWDIVRSWHTNPWAHGSPKLASVLAYTGALSAIGTVMTTYDRNAAVTAVFAARMLLEESARFNWLLRDSSDEGLAERSTRFFDELRYRKKKATTLLTSNGVPHATAHKLLELPDNVMTGPETITKNRKRLPSIEEMLQELGKFYPEPGWICVAYSLLSQVTHSTPVGHLHMARYRNGTLHGNAISPELLGLTLDVTALGSARLLGMSSLLLTKGSSEAQQYSDRLAASAYTVHNEARLVHGLD